MPSVSTSAGPVILYELNEVPWRVLDWYMRERPQSAFASVLRSAQAFTTVTFDEGELQPWVTWPTLHRSVYNRTHGIRYINQDLSCARDYPPVWEKIARAGKKVGVFGSLQSYPPLDDASYVFYVPDTFAPGPQTIPPRYECFQRLNLRQTKADRAFAKPVGIDGSAASDVFALLASGLRLRTAGRLAMQLLLERLALRYRSRRPILQAPVAFDVFRHALARATPDFCTFFTNHVAGIMHRYWKYAFPEDFGYALRGKDDAFHRESLLVALDYVDEQVGFLKSYADARRGRLYIASSMGQEAVHRRHEVELVVEDMAAFVRAIGFDKPVRPLAAMHPDYSFDFDDHSHAKDFAGRIEALRRNDNTAAFYAVDVQGKTVGCSAGSGAGFVPAEGAAPYLLRADSGTRLPFAEAGLDIMRRDAGSGYHQPEGILIRYGHGVTANSSRRQIETVQIAPMIMQDCGVRSPAAAAHVPVLAGAGHEDPALA
jgi:hypothetical protein